MNDNSDSRDAGKFLDFLENSLRKEIILRRIGWCANYVIE